MAGPSDGRVVLITGAARGQGRSHAVAFAREGARVALLDVCRDLPYPRYALATEADLQRAAAAVESAGGEALPLSCDVRSLDEVGQAVAATVERWGRIDVVIANAGITDMAKAWDLDETAWDVTIDVNLKGCWTVARHCIPPMRARGRGRIVLISSVAGLRGLSGLAHYSAAKHGVIGLMKALALELAPDGITVNAVCPTNVDTPLLRGMAEAAGLDFEAFRADIGALNALPVDLVSPADVTAAVQFLASEAARHVTGLALPVDAGLLLK